MQKIVIIGSPGAGKSTFARTLGEILQIKVSHLDRYFWQPEWKEKPKEIRLQIMKELVVEDQWIIEGTYLDTSYIRLKAADTIIFLDTPGFICLWRVLSRYFKYGKEPRPDLPEGCSEKLRLHYLLRILVFPFIKRKKLNRLLDELGPEKSKKSIYVFRSSSDVKGFLQIRRQIQESKCQKNTYVLEGNHAPGSLSLV